jgi:uncharacterized protein (DUF305 family)
VLPVTAAQRRLALLAGVALVLALGGGLVLGRGMSSDVARVDHPVDLGFARDMRAHHAQAVAMSEIVHRRSPDPELRTLAFDILSTQQGQIGVMNGWLDVWQPQGRPGPAMAWMGEAHDDPVPGMATTAQIERLDRLPLDAMHEEYLRLMVRHHRVALPMADHAARNATSPLVVRLARSISSGQASEIDLMQDLLRERGHAPELDADHHAGGEDRQQHG